MRMVRLEQQHDHIEDILKRMDKSVESNRELLANMNTILSNRMFLERFLKWVVATIIAGFTVVQGFNWVVEQNQFQGNNPQYVMGRDKEYPVVERRDNARD